MKKFYAYGIIFLILSLLTSRTYSQLTVQIMSSTDETCFGTCDGTAYAQATGGTSPYSYIWDDPGVQTTNAPFNLCPGTYSVTVTDALSATATTMVIINGASPLNLNMAATDVLCNGFCDGSAQVLVSGGVAPYSYSWSDPLFSTTEIISGLCQMTYFVTVSDMNGCTAENSVTVLEPSPLGASVTSSDVLCYGGIDGTASVSASGGTIPYSYYWINTDINADLFNLAAGSYNVTVTDNNGCTVEDMAIVNEPVQLIASIMSSTDVTCFGSCDGTADVYASGGMAPYTYLWDDPIYTTTSNVGSLCAGTYNVTVTDANGCVAITNVIINENPQLTSSISSYTNVSCYGMCDGYASVSASGGTGFYTYNWSLGGGTNMFMTNACSGTYNVTVTDDNGCTTQNIVTIAEPVVLTSVISTWMNEPCFGDCAATATVSATGGTGSFTYLWPDTQTSQTAIGLCVGSFTATVTDDNGCTSSSTATITEPTSLSASVTPTDCMCYGTSEGTATANVNGGTSPYTYAWSNGQTDANALYFNAGSHSVTVTDINGCNFIQSFTINQPPYLSLTSSYTNETCFASCDGTGTINVSGGTAPYTYSWPDSQTTSTATGLCAGNYTGSATDANGCQVSTSISINPQSQITINATITDEDAGMNNGAVNITVNGGTAPYTYLWSNSVTTEDISGIAAGSYDVTVTDMNGCMQYYNAIVNQNAGCSMSASISSYSNVLCNGNCDGYATVLPAGGTVPYSYTWSNSSTNVTISGLCAGTYSVTVTDANTCTAVTSVSITQPTPVTASISSVTNVTCNGSCDGSMSAMASGGTPSYTFLWNTGATTTSLNGLCVGSYTVTITDSNGCTATASATVTQPVAITVSISGIIDPSCNGLSDGSATAAVSGGTSPYTYAWSNGETSQTAVYLYLGTYTVTATDNIGCTSTSSISVSQPPAIVITSSATDNTCLGACDGTATLNVSGGAPPYSYTWQDSQTTQTVTNLCTGMFVPTVVDANGCSAADNITISAPPQIVITGTVTNEDAGMSNGAINITVTGGTGSYSYIWSNSAITEDISGLVAGTYSVTVTDLNGCAEYFSAIVSQNIGCTMSVSISSVTNISCFGAADGTVSAMATGGTSPYSYLWNTSATTPTITSLLPNNYTVTVTDNNSCTATASAVVTQPSQIMAITSVINASSVGGSDGAINLTVNGGVPPYAYLWSNTSVVEDITNLSAGAYTVTITDANGCIKVHNALINEPGCSIMVAVNITPVTTSGGSNGAISTTVSNFSAPLTYSWSNGATTASITGIAAGNYILTVTDATLCQAVKSYVVPEIVDDPGCTVSAAFIADTISSSMEYQLTDASGGVYNTWFWTIDNAYHYQVSNPVHVFSAPGYHSICLVVSDSITGCQSQICQTVFVDDLVSVTCNADFAYFVDQEEGTVHYNAFISGAYSVVSWNFGDLGASNELAPSHTYSNPGYYNVCLATYDGVSGCSDMECKNIYVGNFMTDISCDAAFIYTVNNNSLTVSFDEESNGNITSWAWSFGDGQSSNLPKPVHAYTQPGYYEVVLTVMNSDGSCSSTVTELISVGVVDCHANFIQYIDNVNKTVNFTNQSLGTLHKYIWNFGDNTYSYSMNPVHTYTLPGVYTICLTVKDTIGNCMSQFCKTVQVGIIECNADFTSFNDGTTTVQFFNQQQGGATILSWEFGDGTLSNIPNPVHTYANQGIYTVTLSTMNSLTGCSDSYTQNILVGDLSNDCEADYIYTPDEFSNLVEFYDNSMAYMISQYVWNFGDGTTSTEQNPVHIFATSGYKNVCLTIYNSITGCVNTTCKTIVVGNMDNSCNADFSFYVDPLDYSVGFMNYSSGDISSYIWDFGDGNTSTEFEPVHQYATSGYYPVMLYIENQTTGCSDWIIDLVNTDMNNNGLAAIFSYDNVSAGLKANEYSVDFVGAAFGEPAAFNWDFGDGFGEDSTSLTPTYAYSDTGTYNVCFTVYDPNTGDSDTYCNGVIVEDPLHRKILVENELDFSVWPNPVREKAVISINSAAMTDMQLAVYDMTGRKVIDRSCKNMMTGSRIILNMNDLESGVYNIIITTPYGKYDKPLIVISE